MIKKIDFFDMAHPPYLNYFFIDDNELPKVKTNSKQLTFSLDYSFLSKYHLPPFFMTFFVFFMIHDARIILR
ncbi:MAG: hypothetical protein A2169_12285 [Deltaproteobacteria bacterium RBG_13_47_9]|nr:MAG: hypothetical protein A2169_12285 [Deltaproteobacteria bacterium RBG_13_47_9]